ncbi:MAG: hypothetical protein KA146_06780 [Leptospiraceae bacterium]|nr:hypothetical protein [Leptospiraceae bacterium]
MEKIIPQSQFIQETEMNITRMTNIMITITTRMNIMMMMPWIIKIGYVQNLVMMQILLIGILINQKTK